MKQEIARVYSTILAEGVNCIPALTEIDPGDYL